MRREPYSIAPRIPPGLFVWLLGRLVVWSFGCVVGWLSCRPGGSRRAETAQNRPQIGPKSSPKGSETAQNRPQIGPKSSPKRSKIEPKSAKTTQEAPKTAQDAPKTTPGPPKGRPGGRPGGSESHLPPGPPRRPIWARFWTVLGSIWGRFGVDFWPIRGPFWG